MLPCNNSLLKTVARLYLCRGCAYRFGVAFRDPIGRLWMTRARQIIASRDTQFQKQSLPQRQGPFPNSGGVVFAPWETVVELDADATSHVDGLDSEADAAYNYRVVAMAERGGSTISETGACLLFVDGGSKSYDCRQGALIDDNKECLLR